MKKIKGVGLIIAGFISMWLGTMIFASMRSSFLDLDTILPESLLLIPEFIWYLIAGILVVGGFYCLTFGRKFLNHPRTLNDLNEDQPFTLFLRPFDLDQDDELVDLGSSFNYVGFSVSKTIEIQIQAAMKKFGDFVSLSNPKIFLQTPGAKRFEVSDSDWQEVVVNLLSKCHTVVITLGATKHMMWEIKMAIFTKNQEDILFVHEDYKSKKDDRLSFFKELATLFKEYEVPITIDPNDIAEFEDNALYGLGNENNLFPIKASFVQRFSQAIVNQEVYVDTLVYAQRKGLMKRTKLHVIWEWFVFVFFIVLTLVFFYAAYIALTL